MFRQTQLIPAVSTRPSTLRPSGQVLARHPARTGRALALTPMAAAVAASLFSMIPNAATAATLNVGVSGCTLANAISNANGDTDVDGGSGCVAGSGTDTITLPAASTVMLATALPPVASRITIEGNGATVRRDASAAPFRVFFVGDTTGELSLNQTTISGGLEPTGSGGGIYSRGKLSLDHCTVSGNGALRGGGVLHAFGSLVVSHSTISGNSASAESAGLRTTGGTSSLNTARSPETARPVSAVAWSTSPEP